MLHALSSFSGHIAVASAPGGVQSFAGACSLEGSQGVWAACLGGRLQEALALGVSAGLQRDVRGGRGRARVAPRDHPEAVGVGAGGHVAAVPAEAAVELVEDAVVLVQVAQLQQHRDAAQHNTLSPVKRVPAA